MRCVILLLAFLLAFAVSARPQTAEHPVRSVLDPGVITTRQQVTPAGSQTVFAGRVYGIAFGRSDAEIYVLGQTHLYVIDAAGNRVERTLKTDLAPGTQGIAWDAARKRILISGVKKAGREVILTTAEGADSRPVASKLGTYAAGGVAVASETPVAVVALTYDDELAVIDLESGHLKGKVKTGIAPFTAVLNRAGTVAYVSNWGGRRPRPGEKTAPTGYASSADQVVVDDRGIAATGSVSRVDLAAMKMTDSIPAGLHPTALFWDEARSRLYVASNNSDSVSVVDTAKNAVVQTIRVQPFQSPVHGVAPTALVASPDGKRLYVACGGINAVAVVGLPAGQIEGLIPTGWYPDHVALSGDGRSLVIATLLGVGSGANDKGRYVHANRGSVQIVRAPDAAQLANYSTAVAENNHLRLRNAAAAPAPAAPRRAQLPMPVPERAGDPSLIEHVVYIIKENRSYDQVFGDMAKGNGDPNLVMYGRDVTTNHHKLADEFVLLDNFYATGGNSGDGHQWVTQGAETAYCYWPGYEGRSYPFDGGDPIAYASSGFIWDAVLARKKTAQIFGEFAGLNRLPSLGRITLLDEWKKGGSFSGRFHTVAPIASLNRIVAADYPSYGGSVPDVIRARILLDHLSGWEKSGQMPNLVIAQLPSDHTGGTTPGFSTPKAAVADNDLALGQIVEGLSHSRFWKKMVIFVVEDDAQNGVDHVDGHRTVALAISPYIRRGSVDSTFYSHTSMLKTMELILGLPTLSLFDLIANDMRDSFQNEPDFTPYTAVEPVQSIFEVNPPAKALSGEQRKAALASARMNFREPDAAPTERLNRILWFDAKGWKTPYPPTVRSAFSPYALDLDDDERERRR